MVLQWTAMNTKESKRINWNGVEHLGLIINTQNTCSVCTLQSVYLWIKWIEWCILKSKLGWFRFEAKFVNYGEFIDLPRRWIYYFTTFSIVLVLDLLYTILSWIVSTFSSTNDLSFTPFQFGLSMLGLVNKTSASRHTLRMRNQN